MELYFWTFVVAILIFGLGTGISLYEEFSRLHNPKPVTNPIVNEIRRVISAKEGVLSVNEHLKMHIGPQDILLNLGIEFTYDLTSDEVEAIISELEYDIKEKFSDVKRVFIEAQSRAGHNHDKGSS